MRNPINKMIESLKQKIISTDLDYKIDSYQKIIKIIR